MAGKRAKRVANPPPASSKHERLSEYTDKRGRKTRERELDAMAEDSFPASDPPSFTGMHSGRPKPDTESPPKLRRRGARR
jgi:hypothetical protein